MYRGLWCYVVKTRIPPFPAQVIEAVARVLGETADGLTGSEIEVVLGQSTIADIDGPQQTKWRRIYNALATRQNKDQSANCVIRFITEAMTPVGYRNDPAEFARRRSELNEILIHEGLKVTEEGKIARVKGGKATTLADAAKRAGAIHTELARRGAHPEVLRYCTTELFQKNNFHAMLEASKSIPDRLRTMTGLHSDGAILVQKALFPKTNPRVAINAGVTETDHSEQSGFGNLVEGLLGMYRNTTAHPAKVTRTVTDHELLEAFTTLSMVHRRLDTATVRSQPKNPGP